MVYFLEKLVIIYIYIKREREREREREDCDEFECVVSWLLVEYEISKQEI